MPALFFFFNDTATTEIYTLSLHDALPISLLVAVAGFSAAVVRATPKAGFVGRWQRVVTCQELVSDLKKAGLGVLAPYAWQGQTSASGKSSFKPGSPKPTMSHPCTGAIARLHSHFFNQQGRFGSLDWEGGQVDDAVRAVSAPPGFT